MIKRMLLVSIIVSIVSVGFAASTDPAPNIHGETIGQVAARTGYTVSEIETYFPAIETWQTVPAPMTLDASYAAGRFGTTPAAYIHPRVYFGPAELPGIRDRLVNTRVGRIRMGSIRGRLLQIDSDPNGWEEIDYINLRNNPQIVEDYADLGIYVGAGRYGYHGPWVGGWVNDLAAGTVPAELENEWFTTPGTNPRRYLMHLMPYEALRCLIDDDAVGGARIAAALATLARRFQQDIGSYTYTTNWQSVYQNLCSHTMGLTYDWSYNWMTTQDRNDTRALIAAVTQNMTYLGNDQLPGYPGNTSNWGIIHANLLPMVLSIEGETGYDDAVAQRVIEGLKKWVYVASGPDGAPFEGLTKSTYAPHWLLSLPMRGNPFLGTTYSKNHVRKFYLHTMFPWGGEYVFESSVGLPPHNDIHVFKYAHPNDDVIDTLYGLRVKGMFDDEPVIEWPNTRTTYTPTHVEQLIVDDPLGAVGDSYDADAAYDDLLTWLSANEPLTYMSDYRGLMITRNQWSKDALHLYFEPRNVPGGHTRASRNEFVFSAMGRQWARRTSAVEDTSEYHSVILIDGVGQGKSGGRCPAGKSVSLIDTPQATFSAADAAWAYSFVTDDADNASAIPIPNTPNDGRINDGPLPWMDMPWSFLPNWNDGNKPGPGQQGACHSHWRPYNPVEYAYRTAGLVRGAHSYALILDDMKKDSSSHTYTWQMQVLDDVEIESIEAGQFDDDKVMDVILKDSDGRKLLVRVLQSGVTQAQAQEAQAGTQIVTYSEFDYKKLEIPLTSVKGTFKVMLYPFGPGQVLPKTAWNGNTLMVKFIGQTDIYTFTENAEGLTEVAMLRDGQMVIGDSVDIPAGGDITCDAWVDMHDLAFASDKWQNIVGTSGLSVIAENWLNFYNDAPIVDAGEYTAVAVGQVLQLDATVLDDGLPNDPGNVTLTWLKLGGIGNVTFIPNATVADPEVIFDYPDNYTLALIASDGDKDTVDTVNIQAIALPDPVAHYQFDDPTGTGPVDSTGNTVATIIYSGTTDDPNLLTGDPGVTHKSGTGAWDFWEDDDLLTITTGNAVTFTGSAVQGLGALAGDEITIAFWIKGTGGDGFARILANTDSTIDCVRPATQTNVAINLLGTTVYTFTNVLDDQWHHLAFTVEIGGTFNAYLDGTPVDSQAYTAGSINTTNMWAIAGRGPNGYSRHFGGVMDDVRVFDVALTADEISVLANPVAQ